MKYKKGRIRPLLVKKWSAKIHTKIKNDCDNFKIISLVIKSEILGVRSCRNNLLNENVKYIFKYSLVEINHTNNE